MIVLYVLYLIVLFVILMLLSTCFSTGYSLFHNLLFLYSLLMFLIFKVNIFTTRCNEKSRVKVYCTQAVAIRSGRTHYIWDKIGGGPGRDSYLDCDENDLRFSVHGNTKTVSGGSNEIC